MKAMKKANKSSFSNFIKNKIIFSIHDPNHINHRHVCVFIAQILCYYFFSAVVVVCLFEIIRKHVSKTGGKKGIKPARATNEIQKYGVLFTLAHTHVHRTVANFMMLLRQYLWFLFSLSLSFSLTLVSSILCFAYKKAFR